MESFVILPHYFTTRSSTLLDRAAISSIEKKFQHCDLGVDVGTGLQELHLGLLFILQSDQRGPAGGLRVTSGPRLLVTRPAKLFVDLLLVTTSSFYFLHSEGYEKKS
jgi:hypothetical protein